MENLLFNSSFGVKLTPAEIVKVISDYISQDPKREYKVIVGTDSEKGLDDKADFVTAIVIHRVGNGGRYFWRHIEAGKIYTLRDRMWKEVIFSLEFSKEIVVLLKNAWL